MCRTENGFTGSVLEGGVGIQKEEVECVERGKQMGFEKTVRDPEGYARGLGGGGRTILWIEETKVSYIITLSVHPCCRLSVHPSVRKSFSLSGMTVTFLTSTIAPLSSYLQ